MKHVQRFLMGLLSLSLLGSVSAQDVAESNYPYMKNETAPGFTITIQGKAKNVETVIEQMIEAQSSSKGKHQKGMLVFEEAQFSPVSSEKVTYYFTAEAPSRKDKEHTRVNAFFRDNIGQFITSVTNPRTAENARLWLEDLEINVKIYEMNLVIEDQAKLLEKEMKMRNNLVSDSVQLQKDLVDLQENISENQNEILRQKEVVGQENQRLTEFRNQLEAMKVERRDQQEARRRTRGRD